MSAVDMLVLLCLSIHPTYFDLARKHGEAKAGFAWVVDLRKLPGALPVMLYCQGRFNGVHKIQFIGVCRLGLAYVREIAKLIFGSLRDVRIYRIDMCLDLLGIALLDVATYGRLSRAQNFTLEKSRSGFTFYLRKSKNRTVLIYDKNARRRHLQRFAGRSTSGARPVKYPVTRIEVQLKGKGLPFGKFDDIERYEQTNLVTDLAFWKIGKKHNGLNTIQDLAADALLHKIDAFGVQAVAKMFTAQTWVYLQRTLLILSPLPKFPDLNFLMRRGIRIWMQKPAHFPLLVNRGRS